ncbi:MAG: hypothetical protein BRD49_02050, partial [Bacteroidetes bacterium SW_10_40_5]
VFKVEGDTAHDVGIAPSGSNSADEAVTKASLPDASGESFLAVANGITGGNSSNYDPAPALAIDLKKSVKLQADEGFTDILVAHGSTDAGIVDIEEQDEGLLFDDLAYGDFSNYLSVETDNYTIFVKDSSGSETLGTFEANLNDLGVEGSAITVVASGFADPSSNNDGFGLGLWVATTQAGKMKELNNITSIDNPNKSKEDLKAYPNPFNDQLTVEWNNKGQKALNLKVINSLGQVVKQKEVATQPHTFNFEQLENGLYFLQVSENSKTIKTKTILKQ